MRALVYEAPQVMSLRDVAEPDVGPEDVLIEVAYSGICGSELSGYLGQNSLRQPPLIFGHELSGRVVQVGERVLPEQGLAPGDSVTANPLLVCGHCRYCISGRDNLCVRRKLLGAHVAGSNAELVSVPASSVLRLPEGMPLVDGAMVEPAACAIRAVELSGIGPDQRALVVGSGPIGLFILQVLAEFGVSERYVADLNPARLSRAVSMGAVPVTAGRRGLAGALEDLECDGVEVAFDAVGAEVTRQQCLGATLAGGRVVCIGLHADESNLRLNDLIRSEVVLQGVFAYTRRNFRTALSWLATERLALHDGVLTASLDDGDAWYRRLVSGDSTAKVLLNPRDEEAIP